jgi:hypothetical protein
LVPRIEVVLNVEDISDCDGADAQWIGPTLMLVGKVLSHHVRELFIVGVDD